MYVIIQAEKRGERNDSRPNYQKIIKGEKYDNAFAFKSA